MKAGIGKYDLIVRLYSGWDISIPVAHVADVVFMMQRRCLHGCPCKAKLASL